MGVEIRFLHLVASEALSFEMQGPSSKSKVPYPIDMAATRKCWVGGGGGQLIGAPQPENLGPYSLFNFSALGPTWAHRPCLCPPPFQHIFDLQS